MIDWISENSHRSLVDTEVGYEFILHLLGMNKDVIGKVVLDSQRKAIKDRVVPVPLPLIGIVRGQSDLLTQHPVIDHENGPVKELDLAIPEDMKNARLCCCRILHQKRIMPQCSPQPARPGWRCPSSWPYIKELQAWSCMHLKAVDIFATDHFDADSL